VIGSSRESLKPGYLSTMGITHFDEAPRRKPEVGHIRGTWTWLGEAAGSVGVGLRRIQVPAGGWTTPAHQHGSEEEIFFVLEGRGISWHGGRTCEIGPRDAILYLPGSGAHTIHALEDLDLLAFGTRESVETIGFPRLDRSLVAGRWVESTPGRIGALPVQFVREAELGPPEVPEAPGERPSTVVNLDDLEPFRTERPRVADVTRLIGKALGSVRAGLNHSIADPGKLACPVHCHSAEEEIYVVLGGSGTFIYGDEETPVRPGHVMAMPPGTGIAHGMRAGDDGLECLAYGTREPNDIGYFPHSNKVHFRGIKLIARVERLDYWDGED
jgi:uncharacterized cupin superfamily protein